VASQAGCRRFDPGLPLHIFNSLQLDTLSRTGLVQGCVKAGKVLGRRAVVVDLAKARKMQRDGLGLRPIAAKLGCSVNTLRRALLTRS
jgi:hypothetical protein